MGVSFKISKKGTRFFPKPVDNPPNVASHDDQDDGQPVPSKIHSSSAFASARKLSVDVTDASEDGDGILDSEVSFTLDIFPDGYSIGNPSENEVAHQSTAQGIPKFLHPYDRASDSLFSAIECGQIPGDILDDIPCKYINGTIVCEVRDYRNCVSEPGNVPSEEASPIVNKVRLKISLENVVKDIPLISDSTWTYGDLMEVESRIVKALQPNLCLDPTPNLDRLCTKPIYSKLNLSTLRWKRLRKISEDNVISNTRIQGKKACIDRVPESSNFRLADSGSVGQQQMHENLTTHGVTPSSMLASRSNSYVPDSAIPASPTISNQSKYQTGVGNPRVMHDHVPGSVFNAPAASPSGQDLMNSYTESLNSNVSSIHGKRENPDGPLSPLSNVNKRARATLMGPNSNQQQHVAPQMDGFTGQDSQWKNTILPQQSNARGMQYGNAGMQKYPQQMFEGGFNQEGGPMSFSMGQQGMRYNMKLEPLETDRLDKSELHRNKSEMHMLESEISHMDSQQSRLQQRPPQQFTRPGFPQTPWNSIQPLDNNPRKEEQLQKRKSAQSPRVSTGALPQSPLSSKSGEFSSGSMGAQYGSGAMTAALGSSQKEKSAVNSFPTVGAATSLTSSGNDAMQRQHQAQMAKRRSNSLPKTPGINGVGSPASVCTMGVPLNASSPVGTPPMADQGMLDRFLKIDMLTSRFQLNNKKKKVDELKKPKGFPTQQLMLHLSSDSNNENLKDEAFIMPLSKSLVGGSMNIQKTRVLNFVQTERVPQGNGFALIPKSRTRLIMSEKANDGTVAMLYGEIEDGDYLSVEDSLPTLPNTHSADLLAAQFCSLILREGYHLEGDHVQPKPVQMARASGGLPNTSGIAPNAPGEMQPQLQGQPSNEAAKPSNSGPNNNNNNPLINAPQNMANTRMLPPGNPQALQMSQGGQLPGVSMPSSRHQQQQLDPQQTSIQHQQQQQQHSLMQQQYQRSSALMLASNPHLNAMGQNSNMQQQLGNHMLNKHSPLQLQILQQQQQQQQQPQPQMQMQRKMMMGLGNANMGNLGNNSMVGLQGLGNAVGMGTGRGGTGISGGPMSGMGNSMVGPNPLNLSQASNISNVISQQIRSGTLTQEQAALMASKLRMAQQNRTNILGPLQSSGLGGMAGANRQMQPGSSGLSVLGPSLSRASNINPMQRTAMAPMGPPKLMSNMNIYMNQQQQQQQQMHLQQQMQMQQQQQQQQQLQQQQQQETTSPLQAVLSPPQQVGSPSMGVPQQLQASPQQLSQQRTPMSPQLSSGGIHPPIQDPNCAASPQLSSQTMGSVGSITNSPMELHGVNKSG